MQSSLRRPGRRAVTFIELIMAISILVIALGALMTAMLHVYRSGFRSNDRLFAMQLAQAAIEELRGTQFDAVVDNLGMNAANPDDPLSNPVYNVVSTEEADAAKTFTVTLSLRGYGQVTNATSTSLSSNFAIGQDDFEVNEFIDHRVMITSGQGEGQIRRITSNTTDTLTVTPAWTVNPDATSFFMIDGGKTATATVTWRETGSGELRDTSLTALIIPKG